MNTGLSKKAKTVNTASIEVLFVMEICVCVCVCVCMCVSCGNQGDFVEAERGPMCSELYVRGAC